MFASGIDITMVGLDVTHEAIVGPERVERLRRMGRVGAIVAELIDFYSGLSPEDLRLGRARRSTMRSRWRP